MGGQARNLNKLHCHVVGHTDGITGVGYVAVTKLIWWLFWVPVCVFEQMHHC